MYSRTFEAASSGPIRLDLSGYNSTIEIVGDPDCSRGYVEVYTEADSGPSVEAIDKLPQSRGRELQVHLPSSAGGGVTFVSSGGGFTSTMVNVGGDAQMVVNGQRVEVRGGRTYVNGVEVTTGSGAGGPAQNPAMPIHLRAVVPPGSSASVETHNGSVSTRGVSSVNISTHNGNIRAVDLTDDSTIRSHNGNVEVGATAGRRPAVSVQTHNGNIRALDDDLRLRPRTHNGSIAYPR